MANNDEFLSGVGLVHEFALTARRTGWSNRDLAKLAQNAGLCQKILSVIREGAEVRFKPGYLAIDRTKPFDFYKYFNRHPREAEFEISVDEQDERATKLTEIDFSMARIEMGGGYGPSFGGSLKLYHLKQLHCILFDAKIFEALWDEPGHATLEWLRLKSGITYLDFLGTIFRSAIGRWAIYLFWDEREHQWVKNCYDLMSHEFSRGPSLVLDIPA